jgi:hypothetical protein
MITPTLERQEWLVNGLEVVDWPWLWWLVEQNRLAVEEGDTARNELSQLEQRFAGEERANVERVRNGEPAVDETPGSERRAALAVAEDRVAAAARVIDQWGTATVRGTLAYLWELDELAQVAVEEKGATASETVRDEVQAEIDRRRRFHEEANPKYRGDPSMRCESCSLSPVGRAFHPDVQAQSVGSRVSKGAVMEVAAVVRWLEETLGVGGRNQVASGERPPAAVVVGPDMPSDRRAAAFWDRLERLRNPR